MSVSECMRLMLQEEIHALQVIDSQTQQVENLIEAAVRVISSGGRVLYIGAGTSGRLLVHACL